MTNDRPTYKPCPCGCSARIEARLQQYNAAPRRKGKPLSVTIAIVVAALVVRWILTA
jgi:hypothetical protein